jgi:hypothetical protein
VGQVASDEAKVSNIGSGTVGTKATRKRATRGPAKK